MRQTITEYGLIERGARVGAAVSGGADSMVMLAVLQKLAPELGFSITVLHYEHGIRGAASEGDMDFVRGECEKRGLEFVCERGSVPAAAAETGESIEAAARRLRYDFFARRQEELALASVVLAHHTDDIAETFLFNLVRGSGIDGLTSMKIKRAPGIIRPLYFITRAEIEVYAAENGIAYVTDATNADTDYTRNYLRGEIMPRLARINPRAAEAVVRGSLLLADESDALAELAGAEYARCAVWKDGAAVIDREALNMLHPAVARRVIRIALARCGAIIDATYADVERLAAMARAGRTGAEYAPGGRFFARMAHNALIIGKKMFTIDRNGIFSIAGGTTPLWGGEALVIEDAARPQAFPGRESLVQYVAAEALAGAAVRTRREGDRFCPFGMKGGKKLKDYFIDEKILRERRDEIPLLAVGSEVLWVVGHALGERLRVTEGGGGVCKMSYILNNGE